MNKATGVVSISSTAFVECQFQHVCLPVWVVSETMIHCCKVAVVYGIFLVALRLDVVLLHIAL